MFPQFPLFFGLLPYTATCSLKHICQVCMLSSVFQVWCFGGFLHLRFLRSVNMKIIENQHHSEHTPFLFLTYSFLFTVCPPLSIHNQHPYALLMHLHLHPYFTYAILWYCVSYFSHLSAFFSLKFLILGIPDHILTLFQDLSHSPLVFWKPE